MKPQEHYSLNALQVPYEDRFKTSWFHLKFALRQVEEDEQIS